MRTDGAEAYVSINMFAVGFCKAVIAGKMGACNAIAERPDACSKAWIKWDSLSAPHTPKHHNRGGSREKCDMGGAGIVTEIDTAAGKDRYKLADARSAGKVDDPALLKRCSHSQFIRQAPAHKHHGKSLKQSLDYRFPMLRRILPFRPVREGGEAKICGWQVEVADRLLQQQGITAVAGS